MRILILSLMLMLVACQQADDTRVPAPGQTPAAATGTRAAPATPEERASTQEQSSAASVMDQEFVYGSIEDRNVVGFFALPAAITEPPPGVIMIHERWGLNDDVRAAARRLAAEGYAVLAVDLYGGETPADRETAEQFMSTVFQHRDAALGNLRQAHDYLASFALAPRVAVLGWGLGGTWALESAVELGDRIDAIVMYYGEVVDDVERLDRIQAPLLGIFGADDETVLLRRVQRFRASLMELRKKSEVVVYSGVGHAFANPSRGSYDERAAAEAWTQTTEFLRANLAQAD